MFVTFGDNLQVDEFLKGSRFRPLRVFRKGEPLAKDNPAGPVREDSGFALLVHEDAAQSDLSEQIPHALQFLVDNAGELRRLKTFGAEDLLLEFGLVPGQAQQTMVSLPPPLIMALGRLGMGAIVSVIQLT